MYKIYLQCIVGIYKNYKIIQIVNFYLFHTTNPPVVYCSDSQCIKRLSITNFNLFYNIKTSLYL